MMADYTEQQLKDAARKAYDAGDMAAAKRLVTEARRVGQAASKADDMQSRIAAAKAGTLEVPQDRLQATQTANDVATAMMGLPSTPTGEATAIVERSPYMGFEAVRSQQTPIVGAWADEMAGAGEALRGGSFEHGRQRASEVARIYQQEHPTGAKAASALGVVEGIGASMAGTGMAGARGLPIAAQRVASAVPRTVAVGASGAIGGGLEAASTAAGQAAPGERMDAAQDAFLPGAIFGAGAAVGLDLAVRGLSAGARRILQRSVDTPTVDSLKAAKTAAYRAVDDSGERFAQTDVASLVDNIGAKLDEVDWVRGTGSKMDTWLTRLERTAQRPDGVSLSRLDDLRSNIFKAYRAAPDEVELLDAIRAIDDLIESKAGASDLLRVARDANSRFMKSQLLDVAFERAQRQTDASGSGGNIFNKYLQAVNSIIDNPSKSRWFSKAELDAMREFVKPTNKQQILRRIGKLSPSGNGLMQALNLGAIAINPAMMGVSAMATGAKALADNSVGAGRDRLVNYLATGTMPQAPLTARLPASLAFGSGVGVNALSGSQ